MARLKQEGDAAFLISRPLCLPCVVQLVWSYFDNPSCRVANDILPSLYA